MTIRRNLEEYLDLIDLTQQASKIYEQKEISGKQKILNELYFRT